MPIPTDDAYLRQVYSAGGARGAKPIEPMPPGMWKPGMPCHWTEQTSYFYWKSRTTRFFALLNLAAGIAYIIYRCLKTISIFTIHPALIAYQVFFLLCEVVSVFSIVFRIFELWELTNRNSVDFKRIPNDMIRTKFAYGPTPGVRPEHSNYPSVAVFIPCYNESADLVLETVIGALAIDYPKELLTVFLCDDSKDDIKRSMIAQLRYQYQNVFYVTRPDNKHAKAGNLNYAMERTRSDLVVTLDADFVARPNLLQRMLSYYYVWDPETELYEFNELLAVVQTPQHFRNLSPYDNDPLDQRGTLFTDCIMPGKDHWNASTMIGTTNLINRIPLAECNYYPYHSITEDSAMSLAFHSLGYRTFYVNESLATGLATTSLHSNIRQRSRWLKGDYQILFNWRNSPATRRGLTPVQRFLYLNMSYSRLVSIAHFFYDIAVILLLVFSIPPLDAPQPILFLIFFGGYIFTGILLRSVVVSGGQGLGKSESGSVCLEAIFRFPTVKGLFATLFLGQKLKFKVTDKSKVKTRAAIAAAMRSSGRMPDRDIYDVPVAPPPPAYQSTTYGSGTETDEFESGMTGFTGLTGISESTVDESNLHRIALPIMADDDEMSSRLDRHMKGTELESDGDDYPEEEEEEGYDGKAKKYSKQSKEERADRRADIWKNLKRLWPNVLLAQLLVLSIVFGIFFPPLEPLGSIGPVSQAKRNSALLQIAMALGFALVNLLPHLMGIYLCFVPYVSGWLMTDLVHGRCDQYAVHPRTGKLFVPWSFISLLSLARVVIMIGAVAALAIFVFYKP